MKTEDSSSSQSSRPTSSEPSASWSTPSTHEGLEVAHPDSAYRYVFRQGSAFSLQWSSGAGSSEDAHDAYRWEPEGWCALDNLQRTPESPDHCEGLEDPIGSFLLANMQLSPGLTNMRPSRRRTSTPFEERLDNRIDRLWGNYRTFATASSKGPRVTSLFGRTLSELFRQSKQMAENVSR